LALTLEQLSKNKKENKLNYNSENKALPFSSLKRDEESVKKGELTKPISSIERVDRNLKRIQEKTDRILERTEKAQQLEIEKNHIANESLTSHQQVDNTSHTDRQQKRSVESKKTASTVELHCLKGLPKLIIANVKKNATYDTYLKKWISVLDTDELKVLTNKSAKHISVQVLRLEQQKWFKILKSNNAGARVVEILPEIYSLN
jgi:ribosome-binding ATPase YchF (GTP1/OBG family)